MKLYLEGHDYKYAVEQIMMSVLPARPEYTDTSPNDGDDYAVVSLLFDGTCYTAKTVLQYNGLHSHGIEKSAKSVFSDNIEKSRELQKIIKLSFYNAALKVLSEKPVWGAVTGIRPDTLVTKKLSKGWSVEDAVRELITVYHVDAERAELCGKTACAAMNVRKHLTRRDIALYVGIPFCPTRCAYCSFVSQSVEKTMGLVEPFMDALAKELSATAEVVRKLNLHIIAVYIGGGTPTTLTAEQLQRLLDMLYGEFDLSDVREFSVEAGRPDTITPDKLGVLQNRVTRISVNPQTMSDNVLKAIGRSHTSDDIRNAYSLVRQVLSGCDVNMDVIAGLPTDTQDSFNATMRELISMKPENITVHTLALKRGSRLTENGGELPDKDAVRAMLDTARGLLSTAGYEPYYLYRQKFMSGGFENVGWTLAGHESLYNILIMEELATILAIGGGGSTKLVDVESGSVKRIFAPKYPKEYIEMIDEVSTKKSRITEFYTSRSANEPNGVYK